MVSVAAVTTSLAVSPGALALQPAPGAGDAALVVTRALSSWPIENALELLEDPDGTLSLAQIRAPPHSLRFAAPSSLPVNLGYSRSAYWLRFDVENPTLEAVDWVLEVRYELLDQLALFVPGADGRLARVSGDPSTGAYGPASRTPAFSMTEPPGRRTLYLRVQTRTPVNIPLRAYSPRAFLRHHGQELTLLWLYFGLMFGLFAYNLFLLIAIRDQSYLHYLIYLAGFTAFMFLHNGMVRLLWPTVRLPLSELLVFAGCLVCVGMILFTRSFLATALYAPWLDRLLRVCLAMAIAILGVATLFRPPWMIAAASWFTLLLCLVMFFAGVRILALGFRPARFYVLAWSVLLAGVVLGLLQAVGAVPMTFLSAWGYQISSALEVILLSLALADRINTSNAALETLNLGLEDRVRERTVELQRANAQLSEEMQRRQRVEDARRALEGQLERSQRLEALGRLAGGVAHDMNNALATVLGNATLLKEELPATTGVGGELDDILAAARRGKSLTQSLLSFARQGDLRPSPLLLNELVAEVVRLLARTCSPSISIEADLDEGIEVIEGDRAQLHFAVMNLCLNALQAMPEGGQLRLRTRARSLSAADPITRAGLIPGHYVELRVADSGVGMTPEVQRRAFDPFYTTKDLGEGTGLGLAQVFGAVKQHGGEVTIDSAPGAGCRVTVLLPTAHGAQEPALAEPPQDSARTRRDALVLVVEDDAAVRRVLVRMIEAQGHRTLEAGDGARALELFQLRRQEIDVVLLDVIMPTLDGVETFAELRRIDPDIHVVLASGRCPQDQLDALYNDGLAGFLQKPFEPAALERVLSSALARREDAREGCRIKPARPR